MKRNAIQRSYEPVQIYFFTELARSKGARSFFDIGSNIGSFAVAMAGLPTIERVHAFEPMPRLHAELAANARESDQSGKIRCHPVAISDQNGTVEFSVLGVYSGANGVASTLIHQPNPDGSRLVVQSRTLDHFIDGEEVLPDGLCAVKIDVEGHEMAVLHGAGGFLRRPCLLQIEVYAEDQASSARIDDTLKDMGYRRFWQIGADRYYAPEELCPNSDELLEIIGQAHQAMIDDLRSLEIAGLDTAGGGITRRVGPVQFTLFDPVASFLRGIFRRKK